MREITLIGAFGLSGAQIDIIKENIPKKKCEPDIPDELRKEVSIYPTFEDFSANAKYILLSAYRQSKKNETFSTTLANSIMILNLIRKRPFVTTKELAEKLELSERTVQRYIETLRVAGEWIEYDISHRGWMLQEGKSILWGDI